MSKTKSQAPSSPNEDGRSKTRGILLKNFSPEDLVNKNPDLYQRLFVTFKPLRIEGKPNLIQKLMNDYSVWYEANNAELQAEKLKRKKAAIEKIKKQLAQDDIDLEDLTNIAE